MNRKKHAQCVNSEAATEPHIGHIKGDMSNTFPLVKPVLVLPLLPDEQEALRRHGCEISPFPENRPDLLKGHMITFPEGVQMGQVTSIQSSLHFPDGYSPTLVWSQGWYHLYPERSENGYPL